MNANRLAALVLGLITAGVLAIGWLLGVAPKLAEAGRADDERALVEAQNTAYEAMLATLADKYENIDDLRLELDDLHKTMPERHGLESFLDGLNAKAAAAGVVISIVTMGEPELAAQGADAAPAAAGPALIDIPVTVQFAGALDAALAFVDAAQHDPRVFVVTSFAFDAAGAASSINGSLHAVTEVAPTPAG